MAHFQSPGTTQVKTTAPLLPISMDAVALWKKKEAVEIIEPTHKERNSDTLYRFGISFR